jgi:hypothetical protein
VRSAQKNFEVCRLAGSNIVSGWPRKDWTTLLHSLGA